jgi:hypothetical protein
MYCYNAAEEDAERATILRLRKQCRGGALQVGIKLTHNP